MPVTKEAVAKQVEEIEELLQGVLKGLSVEDQVRFLAKKGYYMSAISKVLRLSGPQIGEILKGSGAESKSKPKATETKAVPADPGDEETQKLVEKAVEKAEKNKKDKDAEAAAVIRDLKLPEARPIIAREIEDSAWFHNLIQGVGKYVYHDIATCVHLDEADLQDAGKAQGKVLTYYQTLQGLKADASHVVDVEADNAELEYALKLEQKYRAKLQRFIDVVTTSMCRECRIRSLTSFVLSPEVIGREIVQ